MDAQESLWSVPTLPMFMSLALISYGLGSVVLRSYQDAADGRDWVRNQFYLSDVMVLLSVYVAALLLVRFQTMGDSRGNQFVLIGFLACSLFWWWTMGIQLLCRLGIHASLPRAAVLGLVVPFSYGGLVLCSIFPIWTLLRHLTLRSPKEGRATEFAFEHSAALVTLAIFVLTLIMICHGNETVMKWAMSKATPKSMATPNQELLPRPSRDA